MATTPKYLTGDSAGINDFIDKFDVRSSIQWTIDAQKLTLNSDLSFRLRWYIHHPPIV